jgi:hypothetical protein
MNDLKELDSVAIIAKDILPFISTPGDMVNGTCVFDPPRSSHENSLAESSVGLQDLTPYPAQPRFSSYPWANFRGKGQLVQEQRRVA